MQYIASAGIELAKTSDYEPAAGKTLTQKQVEELFLADGPSFAPLKEALMKAFATPLAPEQF